MTDREKVIRKLQDALENAEEDGKIYAEIRRPVVFDTIALLKEQDDLGAELTNAVELIHKKNERIKELLKEQEPVKPHYNARTNWYECGACHHSITSGMHCRCELIPAYKAGFCAKCGKAVKWE